MFALEIWLLQTIRTENNLKHIINKETVPIIGTVSLF